MDNSQVNILNSIINGIRLQAMSVKYTSKIPTVKTVQEGQIVIYDDGAGITRLYVITGEGNLGYVDLITSQSSAIADYTITWTANTPTPGSTNTIDDGNTVGDDNEGGQAIADLTAKMNLVLAALRTSKIIAT